MKKCIKCLVNKNETEYFNSKKIKSGLENICKYCRAEFYRTNKEAVSDYKKEWYQKNKKRIQAERMMNKEEIAKRKKESRQKNREKIKKYKNAYNKRKWKEDPNFRLRRSMGTLLNLYLKLRNLDKDGKGWQSILGYTAKDLKEHLEKKFKPGMSWDNYGAYWHIDHIRPQSWFKYNSINDIEFIECWALNNLQPLEAIENIRKSNKWEG